MKQLLVIMFSQALVNNYMLSRILGTCPFIGVSQQFETATGMSLAVVFVMTMASVITWLVQHFILNPLGMAYLQTVSFILVIAALVQLIEMVIKKNSPGLYRALGIYLPLITTNCAVLGVAVINMNKGYGLISSMVNAVGASVGFLLALILMAGLRERIDASDTMPRCMRGLPIALVTASLMAVAFMGFAGLI